MNIMDGYSSRCVCCNVVLSDQAHTINPYTGLFDPVCNACKSSIRKSNIFFEQDKIDLENDVWREPMGSITASDGVDSEFRYSGL